MKYFNIVSIVLGFFGSIGGLYAAYCWWLASTGKIEPVWTVEPGETDLAQMGWIAGIMNSVVESAERNKKAAKLTALAVLLGALSALSGALNVWAK